MEIMTALMFGVFLSSPITIIEHDMVSYEDDIDRIWEDELGNKTYVLHKYDCTQFTLDFVDILFAANYTDARPQFGRMLDWNGNRVGLHCWVNVLGKPYEATSGNFIDNHTYSKYQYVRSGCG